MNERSFFKRCHQSDWKSANITAIHKKGSKKVAGNYRPVSLTSVVRKIFKSIICDSLHRHMDEHNLYSNQQFGFITGRSTVLQLLRILDRWTEILDLEGCIDVIYCDFMKAFDKVPHKCLLNKLRHYDITDLVLAWISTFLKRKKAASCCERSNL